MKTNIVGAVNMALKEEMARDENVVVLGEDVGVDGGVFRATEGLLALYGPQRVMDTPLSESGIVGTSIGMAVYGLKPVAEIQFEGFIWPSVDQIISHASRYRTRSRGRYSCPIVVRAPYGGGIRALEHHSDAPEAAFVHAAGLKMVIPSTPYDTKGLLISAIRDPDPVIFFEPKRIYRAIKEDVPEDEYTVPIGKARVVQEGNDVSVITWGAMVRDCVRAAELIDQDESVEIIDLRTLKPMDRDAILGSVKKTGRAVIVHEAPKTCGVGAEVSALINEKALMHLEAPILRVTGFDTVFPLFRLENYYLPSPERIAKGIKEVLSY